MKKHFCSLLFVLLSVVGIADPGVGIVADKNGNLFYTDLSQVWVIKPDGSKQVAVPNVHTHELYIDTAGNLFGEHLWYNGEQVNTWGHYIWQRSADGIVTKVKDSTGGFNESFSFVRDKFGSIYSVEKSIPSYFWKVDKSGKKTLLAAKSLSGIGRLHITNKGVLFFSNKGDLYAIPPGDSLGIYIKDIGERSLFDSVGNSQHSVLGIWSDAKGNNIYVATGSFIKQIDKKKIVTAIYKSADGWNPSGGVVAFNGDFWVMEYNAKNEVRVNKISMSDRKKIVAEHTFAVYLMPLLLIGAISVGLYFLFRKKK